MAVQIVSARPHQQIGSRGAGAPVVLAHGAGSTAGFALRAFAGPLRAIGLPAVSWDQRRGPARLADHLADLDEVVARVGASVVGGISFGAHLTAFWAIDRSLDGVLLALPAWTGPAREVAGFSAAAAAAVEADGLGPVLAHQRLRHPGWVADELARAWSDYTEAELVAALRAVAGFPAPTPVDLARVRAPAGVVALGDDPFHPAGVAAEWAAAIPVASLVELRPPAPAADRRAIGRAAVLGWLRAGGRPGPVVDRSPGPVSEPR